MSDTTTNLPAQATEESIRKINQDWGELLSLGANVSEAKIQFVNRGREIGLTLIGLCGHEQMRLSFFENIKAKLPGTLTFNSVQKCIHLAHALPEPVRSVEEANRVETQMLLAGGFMELPHREGAQRSHEVSTDVFIFTTFATAKDRLFKKLEDAATWDEQTKASVRQQVESFRKALVEIEAKL
jgi:hypothetical protein